MLSTMFTVAPVENLDINNVIGPPSMAVLFFRVLLTLFFVIFITYLFLRLVKRQQNIRQEQKKWIKIFDYQPLGVNQGLYLMKIYDLTCIVSVSEGQISILREIATDTDEWEETIDSLGETGVSFTKGIGQFFSRKKDTPIKKSFAKNNFQQQLAEQFRRNQHLSRGVFRGRDENE